MNKKKIGKFIAYCRKQQDLTQFQLAEKLDVSDRAVSKWETGRCMPDSAIIVELCSTLGITINELFSGQMIDEVDKEKQLEKNLLEALKIQEQKDRQLLSLEVFIGVIVTLLLFGMILIASLVEMPLFCRIVLILCGFVLFMIGATYGLRIEQTAGYYECAKCHHKYVPSFWSVFLAPHVGRTRYMRCPKCHQRSWEKKVLS